MRVADILFKDQPAATLTQHDDGTFTFQYLSSWVYDSRKPRISLTFPKRTAPFHSANLFPFFYSMLPEGSNKQAICKLCRIDKDDYFGLLVTISGNDTIGAVTVKRGGMR